MKSRNTPNEFNLSLIQQNGQREMMLEKMRSKLAGTSQHQVQKKERIVLASRRKAMGWGWRIAIMGAFLVGNLYFFSEGPQQTVKAAPKSAPRLPAPLASMDVNEQALYWAFALYDFDQLKERFGVQAASIVDAGVARKKLGELMPKVNDRTRFIIARMTPPERKSP
jgi:hypothetical protein